MSQTQYFPVPPLFPTPSFAPPTAPVVPVSTCSKQWYSKRWLWLLIVTLLVLVVFGFMMRKKYWRTAPTNPYTVGINAVTNSERQADLREWANLWQQARRPTVKRILADVLNSELAPVAAPPPAPLAPPAAPQEPAAAAAADPAFTIA